MLWQAQPPLKEGEGPIGLVMAPTRELAAQIALDAKHFGKRMSPPIVTAAVIGGAGVASQISELKRGADIVVCTPGRMIDVLCLNQGRVVHLDRVT